MDRMHFTYWSHRIPINEITKESQPKLKNVGLFARKRDVGWTIWKSPQNIICQRNQNNCTFSKLQPWHYNTEFSHRLHLFFVGNMYNIQHVAQETPTIKKKSKNIIIFKGSLSSTDHALARGSSRLISIAKDIKILKQSIRGNKWLIVSCWRSCISRTGAHPTDRQSIASTSWEWVKLLQWSPPLHRHIRGTHMRPIISGWRISVVYKTRSWSPRWGRVSRWILRLMRLRLGLGLGLLRLRLRLGPWSNVATIRNMP